MLIVELNRGVAALDEYLWTSSGDPLSGGERVDPVRIPVEDDGGWDLDNLRFGSYVAADRDSRLPVAVGVPSISLIVLCGWAWAGVGRDDLVATVALVVPMVIALGAMLAVTRRSPARLGIQISATEVMLGRWPGRTYRFPRSALTQVKMSNGQWVGSSTAVLPSHDFRQSLHYYLQITVRSGDLFCVAADPIDNPVTDRIVRELERTAASSVLEPESSSSDEPEPKQAPPLRMSKDQPKRAPKPPRRPISRHRRPRRSFGSPRRSNTTRSCSPICRTRPNC